MQYAGVERQLGINNCVVCMVLGAWGGGGGALIINMSLIKALFKKIIAGVLH